MEITRTVSVEGHAYLSVEGRVDAYWADQLDASIAEVIRDGQHRIHVDCSRVTFLSSAGIGVLVMHYQQLARISGTFAVVNPSPAVTNVLRLTRLTDKLVSRATAPGVPAVAAVPTITRRVEADLFTADVFLIDPNASIACTAVGASELLGTGRFRECVSLEGQSPVFAIGVGAFGESFADCHRRFGELISVAGATACQPGDGSNVPDYLVTRAPIGRDVQLLYGLVATGAFSHLVRFEPTGRGGSVPLSALAAQMIDIAASPSIAIAAIVETEGLVGAALRQSPVTEVERDDFFAHPAVRSRLSFSAERTFARSVCLIAGVASRNPGSVGPQFRPIGRDLVGHLHAAAFRFQPIQKGWVELSATVTRLFEPNQLSGVVHLLNDDRVGGAGETELIRGACWIAPVV